MIVPKRVSEATQKVFGRFREVFESIFAKLRGVYGDGEGCSKG
jgi:hypothetical protein